MVVKTWLLGPSGLEPSEQETPKLASDELRVQVEAVCLEPGDLARAGDFAPGGGLVGQVIECGAAATAFEGARVLVAPLRACDECDSCRRGFATVCPSRILLGESAHGGCAESIVAGARWLTRLDKGLEIDGPLAALVSGPALAAYALYCRAGVSAGELMIVLGQGPTAAILCRLGETRGAKVISAFGGDASSKVAGELVSIDARGRPQRIFVCDGNDSLAAAVQMANPGSSIVSYQQGGDLDFSHIVDRELSLLGLSYGHPDLMPETAAMVAKGELDLSPFMSHQAISVTSPKSAGQAFGEGRCLVISHT